MSKEYDEESVIGFDALYESMMKCKKGVLWKDSPDLDRSHRQRKQPEADPSDDGVLQRLMEGRMKCLIS